MEKLKGLIIGCGSIGERHIHNLQKIGIKDLSIYDISKTRVDALSKKYKVVKYYNLDSAVKSSPDFSVICTHPNSHVYLAKICVDINSHVFIEKPLSTNISGVKNLLEKAQSKKLKVAVGYNLRFDRGLNILKRKMEHDEVGTTLSIFGEWGQNIKFWRPGSNYKSHYVLKKGGGIILDDSHEYDYIRWLLNDKPQSIFCQTRKIKTIKTKTESLATIMLKFRKGTIVSLIIDYVRPKYERGCHIIGDNGDIKWEYVIRKPAWNSYKTKAQSRITKNTLGQHEEKQILTTEVNEMYLNEMNDFIRCIITNKRVKVDGWEGLQTLQIGLAALESAEKEKVVHL